MRYSKDTSYKQLIQSKEWQIIRNRYIRNHPTCEICGKPAVCVHHRKPLNWYRNDPEKMKQLCFDEDNLQSLCLEHHEEVHRQLGKNKNKKEHAIAYHKEKLENFIKNYLE